MIVLARSPGATAPHFTPRPDMLVSAALHLMTQYIAQAAQDGNRARLACVIERHLKALAGHGELTPVLRATCEQLSKQWAGVVERAAPRPSRSRRFDWSGR